MDDINKTLENTEIETENLAKFTDSYASFNRIINSLQRKYIELKEEFSAQNELLAAANKKLVQLTEKNISANEFLNGILNSTSAGVIAVDKNGRITHFNPAASMILGIPLNEPTGKHYRDIIPPGEPSAANALRTVETGHEFASEEKKIMLSDGNRLQVSVSTAVIKDDDDNPLGAVEVFQDLTKFKKMENEIARLNTLAALGEMAATIAHEVRNPLSGIGGFAALLGRDLDNDDPRKKLVDKISDGVTSLNSTIETLLNYTRFEEINKTDVEYCEFIKTSIQQFKNDNVNRIKDIDFQFLTDERIKKQGVILKIDKLLYRQIFFNIFSNSLDAMSGKGTIKIELKKLPRQTAVDKYADKLILGINETVMETIIVDNGNGIEEEYLDKIFAPFFTKKPEGNGLGLAVAWKIIKTHGGEIFAENNKESNGVAFHLLLPMAVDSDQGEK